MRKVKRLVGVVPWIEPEDKTRKEVLGARVDIYMAAKKWDTAAAVAGHLVKVEPENANWWINLAYATRRFESIEQAEAILLRARELHHPPASVRSGARGYPQLVALHLRPLDVQTEEIRMVGIRRHPRVYRTTCVTGRRARRLAVEKRAHIPSLAGRWRPPTTSLTLP